MLIRLLTCFGLAGLLACSPAAQPKEREQRAESSSGASFQGRIDPRNWDLYLAKVQEHGLSSFSAELRTRLAADTVVMNYYAGLLEGKNPVGVPWDTSVVLWWLAESDDPRYLPVFLPFTRPETEAGATNMVAIYGLARHAEHPDARARLQALARTHPDPITRAQMPFLLMDVDGTAARDLLRATEFHDIHPSIRERVRRHLAQPVRPERGSPPPQDP